MLMVSLRRYQTKRSLKAFQLNINPCLLSLDAEISTKNNVIVGHQKSFRFHWKIGSLIN